MTSTLGQFFLYLVFSDQTLCCQLTSAAIVCVYEAERLGQSGLQFRAVQQELQTEETQLSVTAGP